MPAGPPILQVKGLTKQFQGFFAVAGVDMSIAEGDIHALVGPNGAGKTTLFNLLSGFLRPTAGEVLLAGRNIVRLRPDQLVRLGVARSFQITSLFKQLSPRRHVELALQGQTQLGYQFWTSESKLGQFRSKALELLDQVGLADLAEVAAQNLAYGQKRALEVALALASDPKLLLLDEPTAGMGMEDVERTVRLIQRVRAGRTVVLVEHNMQVVADLADRVTVMQAGQVLIEGTYREVRSDPTVISAYLGTSHA